MEDVKRCSRCDGSLRKGFIEDKGERGGLGTSVVLAWIDGAAEKGMFGGARVAGKSRYDITAYRCDQCGHLDLFVI